MVRIGSGSPPDAAGAKVRAAAGTARGARGSRGDVIRLLEAGEYGAAQRLLRGLRVAQPEDPDLAYLAAWCAWSGFQDAPTALGLLEALRAKTSNQLRICGHILEIRRALGVRADIVAAAEDVLAIAPNHSIALSSLEQALRPQLRDPLTARIQAALAAPGQSPRDRKRLHYALAQVADRSGCYAEAFQHLLAAKRFIETSFDLAASRRHLAEIRERFSTGFLEARARLGVSDRRPVFILGLPRTGGTLLERSLAAHPKIGAAGEPGLIDQANMKLRAAAGARAPSDPLFAHFETAQKARLRSAGAQVLERLSALSSRKPALRILDKTPPNLFFVGAIRILFPEAVIIHPTRCPLDSLLSCFFQNFIGLEWTRSLEDLASYFEITQEAMAHWGEVCGDRIVPLQYESLIERPEAELRRVVDRIGLPWSEACLAHQEAEGVVLNASQFQVREAMHRRSIGRWKNYQRELAPLIDRLGPHLNPCGKDVA